MGHDGQLTRRVNQEGGHSDCYHAMDVVGRMRSKTLHLLGYVLSCGRVVFAVMLLYLVTLLGN